jgi:hypothetical protein
MAAALDDWGMPCGESGVEDVRGIFICNDVEKITRNEERVKEKGK